MAQAMQRPQHGGAVDGIGRGPRGHVPHSTHFRGRQHVAAIVVVVTLALIAFRVFPGKDVLVLDNGHATHVRATFDAQSEALSAANVNLSPADRVLFAETNDRASVAIQRARAVRLDVDGQTVQFHTRAVTVAGVLATAGVELRAGDEVFVNGTRVTERAPLEAVAEIVSALQSRDAGIDAAVAQEPRISVVRAARITILMDTTTVTHHSAASTVDGALREMGILVREGDLVEPGLDTPITAGMQVRIAKARNVAVILDGQQHTMITQAASVAAALDVLGIELGPADVVTPALSTNIESGMTITIALTREVEEETRESIAPPVTYVSDASLPAGETRIEQGTEGVRVSRYRVIYKNGIEQTRELVGSEVVQAATPTRVVAGIKPNNSPITPASPSNPSPDVDVSDGRRITVLATWYNASHGGKTPDDPWYGYTATGVRLEKGICATDPNVIPMGTWMYIPGYGNCLAADVGGGVKGNHVDLGFPESAGANPWGTQTLDIYILD